MVPIISQKCRQAQFKRLCVTMGAEGSVWADIEGNCGYCPAKSVVVADTTGAGDAFFSGVAIGLTYGKSMEESCEIGTRLAASVLATTENVCPRFLPSEFGIEV
jgi:pseudouridine kinase